MNPELRRLIWLDFTPQRLVAMPAVLGLLLTAIGLAQGRNEAAISALYAASALVLLWGPRLAAQSLLGEVAGGTWDTQRAGGLTAWGMMWAKLVGSTAYVWWGFVLCLGAAWVLAGSLENADMWLEWGLRGALAQAVALLAALIAVRGDMRARGRDGFFAHATGVLVALGAGSVVDLGGMTSQYWGHLMNYRYLGRLLPWWLDKASMAFFTLWAVLGSWRLMAETLQIRTASWVWPGFLLFMALYAAGFADDAPLRLAAAFAAVLPFVWLFALVDPKSPVTLRRWLARPRLGDTPVWLAGLGVLAVLAGLLVATGRLVPPLGLEDLNSAIGARQGAVLDWRLVPLPVLAFLLRDIALMHLVAWGGLPGRGAAAVLVYQALLYGVLPAILISGDPGLAWVLLPVPGLEALPLTLGAPLLQALLLGALAWRRYRKLMPTSA